MAALLDVPVLCHDAVLEGSHDGVLGGASARVEEEGADENTVHTLAAGVADLLGGAEADYW